MGEREPATTYRKCLDATRPTSFFRDALWTYDVMLSWGSSMSLAATLVSRPPERQGPWGAQPAGRPGSEGQQRLQLWINGHGREGRLLLKQHLARQLRQAGIALPAERQILNQLPAALLQAGFAGQRSHGRAPRRTPQPAGGGSRARPPLRCAAQRSQRPSGGHVSTLEAPPQQ